jgi:hypothetical protein
MQMHTTRYASRYASRIVSAVATIVTGTALWFLVTAPIQLY